MHLKATARSGEALDIGGLTRTRTALDALATIDKASFALLASGDKAGARQLLFSNEYDAYRRKFTENVVTLAQRTPEQMRLAELRGIILHLDEVLTMSAKMAVSTGDPSWERRYRDHETKLDAAIREAQRRAPATLGGDSARRTGAANEVLVRLENRAFGMLRRGDVVAARALLSSAEYRDQKQIYKAGMDEMQRRLADHAQASVAEERANAIVQLSVIAVLLLGLGIGWLIVWRQLNAWEQVQEQQAVLRSEALQAADAAILITNERGEVQWANAAYSTMTGFSLQEVIGRRPELLDPDTDDGETISAMWDTVRAGQSFRGELTSNRKDGTAFPVAITITPVRDEAGQVDHYVAIGEDVTERHRYQQAIVRARQDAEAANEAKSLFLANMSHELRTPMNGIIGMSGVLAQTRLTARQRDQVRIVQQSAEALMALIEDVLDFSKLEAGRMQLEIAPFSLREALQALSDRFEVALLERGVSMAIEVDGRIPDRLLGDAGKIGQMLTNYVANALKFGRGEPIKVQVELQPGDRDSDMAAICFSVIDTGIGIAEADQAVIFGRFQQVDGSATRRFAGTGLGLAICRQLAELMGGEVGVQSAVGAGSTFFFDVQLPTVAADESASAPAVVALNTDLPPRPLSPVPDEPQPLLRVLVVDDSDINRETAREILALCGCAVDTAADGHDAVARMTSGQTYDLILMDLQMPELDGLEATRRIRAMSDPDAANVPIVAMTAHAREEDRQSCLDAGMNDYLAKPVRIARIQELVAAYLPDQRGAERAG